MKKITRLRLLYIYIASAGLLLGVFSAPSGYAQAVVAGPTPTPAPVVAATPAVQSLNDLQGVIRRATFAPQLRRGRLGIKITTLAKGTVVFEQDSEKYFIPASNMKNFTVAAALEMLTPDYRFVTRLRAASLPDSQGVVKGNVTVVGGGDISMSEAFYNGDSYRGLDLLAEKLSKAGVKRIEGDLIADESFFRGFKIPETWEWDDLDGYYGTEISALPLNDNAVTVRVMPGSAGNQCIVRILPANTLYRIINKCMTARSSAPTAISIVKSLDQNVVEVSGSIGAGQKAFEGALSFTAPAELFVSLLKDRLQKIGITVTGRARLMDDVDRNSSKQSIEIATHDSPPLSLIAAKTMKPSQNMYTETLLWTLGEVTGRATNSSDTSAALGLAAMKNFFRVIGIPDDAVVQYDGSGLSRHNLVTPSSIVTLYAYMASRSKYPQAWMDSLTVGGVDGTLARRFTGTAAQANMRGKTGTLNQVSALSGYVTTAAGERLIVSLVINEVPGATSQRTRVLDEIVVALANFNGKID